jgi:RNA polymerase sigma-70 factor (ECF subfamily)
MQQAGCGDRRAFEVLYDRYFDRLVWFARGFLNDEQKAEDAVQEVFMKIIKQPEHFDTDKKFSTWVYTITGNSCKNILRNEQNRQRLMNEQIAPLQDSSTTLVHTVDYQLLKQQIRTLLDSLSEKERSIYLLRFEQELSIKEIADTIGIPEGSVKSGIYYLVKKFSNHLKAFTHENRT